MALTPSSMVALGTSAPDFALPDTDGSTVQRSDFEGRPLVVMFICNHCPYVKHVADALGPVSQRIQDMGIAVVAISSNDAEAYPDDASDKMRIEKAKRSWPFPYLYDASQDTARDFDATCTPDFFLYNAEHRLVYRGQFDASRPGNELPVTGEDLLDACRKLGAGSLVEKQVPSMGCNIKWK